MKNRVYRVLRGGCFINDTWYLRVSFRFRGEPEGRVWNCGFRFVMRGEQ